MKNLLFAILMSLGASLSSNAQAAESGIEVITGVTQFHRAANGQWYQKGFPYETNMVSPSVSVAWKFYEKESWSYHIGSSYLGKVTSQALAVKDMDYDLKAHACYVGAKCTLVQYNGSGTVGGLTLVARNSYENWLVEYGVILERGTWQMDMPDWTDDNEPRFHHHVEHKVKPELFPTLGVGYKFNNTTLVKCSAIPAMLHGGNFPAVYNGVSLSCGLGFILK